MNYRCDTSDLSDVKRHLINKNLLVLTPPPGVVERALGRLSSLAARITAPKPDRNDFQLVVSEQIIEYPLIIRNLRDRDKTVLDFGGFESVLPLQLSALGYRVTVLDQRHYPFCHPNLTVWQRDLFGEEAIAERFDVVLSVSTIEHLGLGAYGDITEADADKRGVEHLWNLVGEGGRLMASVPAGKPAVQRGYRVYDEARVREVFPHATSVQWFKKSGREGVWLESSSDEVSGLVYSEPYGEMPVEAMAFVICDR